MVAPINSVIYNCRSTPVNPSFASRSTAAVRQDTTLLGMDAQSDSQCSVPPAVGRPPVKRERFSDADDDEVHGDHVPEGEDKAENQRGEDQEAGDTRKSRRDVLEHVPSYAPDDKQSVESFPPDHARGPTAFQQLRQQGRCLRMFLRGMSKANDGTFTERRALVYPHSDERYGTLDTVPAEARHAYSRQPTGFSRQEFDERSDGRGGDREYLLEQVRAYCLLNMMNSFRVCCCNI